ncbi:MAG: hypothetical protein NVSMB27_41580 [Ktedonobacteraceae bacterium]
MMKLSKREIHLTTGQPRLSVGIGWRLAFQARAGRARGFLRFWPLWEWFTHSIWHVQPIPNAPHHLLEVRFINYTGKPIDLLKGASISRGDFVIELHFRNQAFLEIGEHIETWKYMYIIAQNLRALALWMQQPDFPGHVQAIYGVTLLYRAAPRLGFTLYPRPGGIPAWLERFFMNGLLVLYDPRGQLRLLQGTTHGTYPQEVWMSREELLKRYG